jgi:endo-1,4-beta-xylanase
MNLSSPQFNPPTDSDIKKHRTAEATLTLLGLDKKPLANQEVTVAQTNHKFLFGTTGSAAIAYTNNEPTGEAAARAEEHAKKLVHLFNFVTLPFYWGRFEQKPGQTETTRLLNAAKWFVQHGCAVKGHPLCWHTVCADWLMEYPIEKIIETQRNRIRREVTDFAGVIDMWDVINEVVIMPNFDKYDNAVTRICHQLGRIGIVRMTFDAARAANPKSMLLLNDFDTSPAFECLIEGCLEGGIKIDAIGIQSHMHQGYWGVEKTHDVLKRFSRYGLPIHFTESTLVSGKIMPPEIVDLNDYQVKEWPSTPEGEQRQADEAVTHYKTLFAHPLVEAITWWGLNDGGWLKAPTGLLRQDESTKPAYTALENLIKRDWWLAPTKLTTNAQGQAKLTAYLGNYSLSCRGKTASFTLDNPGNATIKLSL